MDSLLARFNRVEYLNVLGNTDLTTHRDERASVDGSIGYFG